MKEQKFTVGQIVKHRSNPDIPLLVERSGGEREIGVVLLDIEWADNKSYFSTGNINSR